MPSHPFTELLWLPPPPGIPAARLQRYERGPMHISFLRVGDACDAQDLEIPPEEPAVLVTVEAPQLRQEFAFQLFGTYVTPESPPDAPRFYLCGPAPGPPPQITALALIAWRRRVVVQKTQDWVEVRWHPAQGEATLEHREASTRSLAAAREADDALKRGRALLHTILGRPAGTGTYRKREEFLEVLVPLVKHVKAAGVTPTQHHIAERWNARIPTRQLQRWFRDYVKAYTGETWHAFVARV